MFENVIGVVTGIFFIYLLLSLICSALIDRLARLIALRARVLEHWVRRLFNETGHKRPLTELLQNHPLVEVLAWEKWIAYEKQRGWRRYRRPACIPPRTFAIALLDVLSHSSPVPGVRTVVHLKGAISAFSTCHERTRRALFALVDDAGESVEKAIENIGAWFNDPAGAMTSLYRRKVQLYIFWLALALCAGLNLDTFLIANTLWQNTALRAQVAERAAAFVSEVGPEAIDETTQEPGIADRAVSEIANLGIPAGWCWAVGQANSVPRTPGGVIVKISGLLSTALAASLGAPFWFDLLRKIVGMRTRGGKEDAAGAQGMGSNV
jgi:hypothetical protein